MSSIWMGAFAAVVTCGFMAVGCGSSIDASGGAGGMAGAGGGAGTGGTAGAGGAAGTGGTGGEQMVELARLRVSAMQGDEPAEFSSDTLPGLFVLDSRISSASISFVNEASSKGDEGPATFFPALTPAPPASSPGYIQLTVTPVIGQLVSEQRISYTTAALFANNPSSLRLLHSDDAFAEPLSIIQTDQARTEVVEVESTPGDGSFSFRWQAGNDFDEFGGGRAGFTTNDVVIEGVIVEP